MQKNGMESGAKKLQLWAKWTQTVKGYWCKREKEKSSSKWEGIGLCLVEGLT